ncbi:hypothetical protein ACFOLC_08735 [Lysobacter cavernae]|uniref:Uncharacterized protein n=1 Tax=Lysobacter cavernae TaxID=1685901 RepID=A0ABV7RT17_9GAMM
MNTSLRVVVLALSVAGVAACASTGTASHSPSSYPSVRFEQDTAYIQEYERTAQRRSFVHVNWVNPPMKRIEVEN